MSASSICRVSTVTFVLFSFSCLTTSALQLATYNELATSLLPLQFSFAISQLKLEESTSPDGVKALRSNLLYARDLIDLFSYAYPPSLESSKDRSDGSTGGPPQGSDLLLSIRDDLDEGYTLVGNFQDLAHSLVQYDEADLVALRDKCLEWQDRFVDNLDQRAYLTYLQEAPDRDSTTLYERPGKELSKLFWGHDGTTKPLASMAGYANMAMLMASLSDSAANGDLEGILALDQVYDEPAHAQFHLYRKLIRSILAVLHFFPNLLEGEVSASTSKIITPSTTTAHTGTQATGRDPVGPKVTAILPQEASAVPFWDKAFASATAWVTTAKANISLTVQQLLSGAQGGEKLTSVSSSSYRRSLRMVGIKSSSSGRHEIVAAPTCASGVKDAVATLEELYRNAGDINDDIFAYHFYLDKGEAATAEAKRQTIVEGWARLTDWIETAELSGELTCISEVLKAGWNLDA